MKRHISSFNGKITFINDAPTNPSPNLPVSEHLAKMVENIVRITGLSININSTTGGTHSKKSLHYYGMAIDINLINGKRIDDPSNESNVRRVQRLFSQEQDIGECFGPFINIRKNGSTITQKPQMKSKHLNHLHISSQR
ncbi:MAG: hypothetical protein COB33_012120 [Thiotrichaceae bacterium]|nr:hypothetical protein [Thiotrichaceae bacterium]